MSSGSRMVAGSPFSVKQRCTLRMSSSMNTSASGGNPGPDNLRVAPAAIVTDRKCCPSKTSRSQFSFGVRPFTWSGCPMMRSLPTTFPYSARWLSGTHTNAFGRSLCVVMVAALDIEGMTILTEGCQGSLERDRAAEADAGFLV